MQGYKKSMNSMEKMMIWNSFLKSVTVDGVQWQLYNGKWFPKYNMVTAWNPCHGHWYLENGITIEPDLGE